MKNKGAQMSIALVCVVLGFMVTLQLKSVKKNYEVNNERSKRLETVQLQLKNEQDKNEGLNKRMAQYEKELTQYRNSASQQNGLSEGLSKQLQNAEILAGLSDVEGKGVIVTLDDSKIKKDGTGKVDENNYIVHDEDIVMTLNELKDAGAEALSVNDERILATSEVRCAGSIVSVNNNRISPPFVIKAIGDPVKMEASLNLRGGVVDTVKLYNVEISIKKSDKISIAKFGGAVNFKYAVPMKKGEN